MVKILYRNGHFSPRGTPKGAFILERKRTRKQCNRSEAKSLSLWYKCTFCVQEKIIKRQLLWSRIDIVLKLCSSRVQRYINVRFESWWPLRLGKTTCWADRQIKLFCSLFSVFYSNRELGSTPSGSEIWRHPRDLGRKERRRLHRPGNHAGTAFKQDIGRICSKFSV